MVGTRVDSHYNAGKLALVTGAQQGIGREVALALARTGADIIACYHDDNNAAIALSQQIQSLGIRCHLLQADLASTNQINALMNAIDEIGTVDILVNNAAIFPREDFLRVSETLWDEVQAVNLKAPFLISQYIARKLIEHGRSGSIINITSGAAFRGSPRGTHYVTSKAALVGLTKATALELADNNIRVNAVAPGLTDTAQPRYGMTETDIEENATGNPMSRIGQPQDIASLVLFLASSDAAYVTGQTWHVNGGSFLG